MHNKHAHGVNKTGIKGIKTQTMYVWIANFNVTSTSCNDETIY